MAFEPVDEKTIAIMLRVSREEQRPVTILMGRLCFHGCQKIEIHNGYLVFWHPRTDIAFRIPTRYVFSISINAVIVITIDIDNEDYHEN